MTRLECPTTPGHYRWYYVDVSNDEYTAVVIFMVGSLFSRRYAQNHRHGVSPDAHAAVNFALYRHGTREAWVLSEYSRATLSNDGSRLDIGASSFTRTDARQVTVNIVDRTPWWPRPVEVELTLTPEGPAAEPITLVDGLEHQWFPFAVRARGEVNVKSHGVRFNGRGYHDGNAGTRVLGTDLSGWSWMRTHRADASQVVYQPDGGPSWRVDVDATSAKVERLPLTTSASRRTGWGLSVPSQLGLDAPVRMLESSPFYARMEATRGDGHTLGESGDFARFHSPFIRWMADMRTHLALRKGAP